MSRLLGSSKAKKGKAMDNEDYVDPRSDIKKITIDRGNVNVLLGRMLTVAEASFPDKEQREAVKRLVMRNIWHWYDEQSGENTTVEAWAGSPEMCK